MREEYCVYYENYEELAQEEPGAEIPLQKDIVWENKNSQSERWKALSVFACPQGLVLELAKQVASKQYLAFYEKWKEADEDRLTDRQLSQIEAESPLDLRLWLPPWKKIVPLLLMCRSMRKGI